jgi:hypothetical protein
LGDVKPTHIKNPKRQAAGTRIQAKKATAKQQAKQATAPQQQEVVEGDGDGYGTVMMGLAVIGVVIGIANVYLMVCPPATQTTAQAQVQVTQQQRQATTAPSVPVTAHAPVEAQTKQVKQVKQQTPGEVARAAQARRKREME